MRRRLLAYIGSLRLRRIVLVGGAAFLTLFVLLIALVASLPALLSTSQAQSLLRLSISKSLKRPVSWSNLSLSWSEGISLSGLNVPEGPPHLVGASVGELRLVPEIDRDSSGRFKIGIDLRVKKLEAQLAPGPKKPPEEKPAKDPLTQVAEAVQKFQGMEWPLSADLRLSVDAAPMTVEYLDPATGKKILLHNLAFRLAMPSLATLPIDTSLSGTAAVGEGKPQPVNFNARISGLVTNKGRIRPAAAHVSADAGFPGVELGVDGGLDSPGGLAARLRLALPGFAPVLATMAHRKLPTLGGTVALDLKGSADREGDLRFLFDLAGKGLAVRDIPGRRGSVAPLDLQLHQGLTSDHKRQRVTFTDGSLASPGLVAASWEATVDRPTERSRSTAARLAQLTLDLGRARQLALPFLPPNLPLRELKGAASIRNATARLAGPENDGEVRLEKGGIDLPLVRLALPSGEVHGERVALGLEKVVLPLEKGRPNTASADVSLTGARLQLAGKKPVLVRGMTARLALQLSDIDPAKKRVVADARQSLDVEEVSVGTELVVERLHEELRGVARALGGGELEGTVHDVKVTAAAVRTVSGGKKVTLAPVAATLQAEGFHLPQQGNGSPSLRRAVCTLSAADALALAVEGSLPDGDRRVATTKGTARLDLGRLMPLAARFVPAGVSAGGSAAAKWDVTVPLSAGPRPPDQNPIRKAKGALGLLDRGEVSIELDRVDLKSGVCQVKNLGTAPALRLSLPRPSAPVAIDAGFRFDAVSGLPGNAGKLPLQSGKLTLQGELAEWKELRLTEELRVDSLMLSQVAELTVGRIDTLLEDGQKFDTATLLKRLDATMFAHLEGNFPREARQLFPGLLLSGNVSAGGRFDLTAAKELRVRGYTKCRDLGIADGKGLAVSGIRADLVVDRSFALAQGKGDGWVPLSTQLVRPVPVAPLRASQSDLAARIYEDLRGEASGPRKIGVKSASLRSGPFPLTASALEADLLLEPEAIGVSFFQAEVGGGTVRARGMIDLSREVPLLSTYCNFSRLDPAILFPAAGAARPGQEGELTGELSLSAPLAAERRALLEGLRLNLNLRRFSSRVLDRALFAIDPYQRNEKVVAQRKSLKLADLKGLRVTAVDGALDCEGELLVKGVGVDLPKLERLRLSELPIRKELEAVLAGIASSKTLIDLVRADTLVVNSKGGVALKRRNDGN